MIIISTIVNGPIDYDSNEIRQCAQTDRWIDIKAARLSRRHLHHIKRESRYTNRNP